MAERWKAWRQHPAFHRSLEISPNRRFPHFHSSGGGCFLLIGRGLRTTKTETVYTEILTPPDLQLFAEVTDSLGIARIRLRDEFARFITAPYGLCRLSEPPGR